MSEEDRQDADLAALANSTFEKYQETGNGIYLLQAIREYSQYQILIPRSVWMALDDALMRYSIAEPGAETLDDAFGVSRAENQSKVAVYNKRRDVGNGYSKAYAIWRKGQELLAEGPDRKGDIWTTLGESFGVSRTTAKNYFNEVDGVMSRDKSS